MALQDISRRAGPYSWADTRTYTFGFKVFSTSQVEVAVLRGTTETVLTSSLYTVTLNQDQENQPGGTVVLANGVETADKVAITSAVPYTQEMELTNQGGFYPDILNSNDDRIVAQIQQLKEGLARAIKVGATSSTSAEAYKADLETTVNNAASDAETAAAAAEAAQEAAEAAQGAAEDAAGDAADALDDVTTAINGIPTAVSTAVTAQDIPGQVEDAVAAQDIPQQVEDEVTRQNTEQLRETVEGIVSDISSADLIVATGSTEQRSLGNRFADVINVKDFGAKGDGVTDDTASIKAAIEAGAASGKEVVFPAGKYIVSRVWQSGAAYPVSLRADGHVEIFSNATTSYSDSNIDHVLGFSGTVKANAIVYSNAISEGSTVIPKGSLNVSAGDLLWITSNQLVQGETRSSWTRGGIFKVQQLVGSGNSQIALETAIPYAFAAPSETDITVTEAIDTTHCKFGNVDASRDDMLYKVVAKSGGNVDKDPSFRWITDWDNDTKIATFAVSSSAISTSNGSKAWEVAPAVGDVFTLVKELKIAVLTPIEVHIKGDFQITRNRVVNNSALASLAGLHIQNAVDCTVDGITVENFCYANIRLSRSYNCTVRNCLSFNANSASTGYAYTTAGCNSCQIIDCVAYGCRSGYTNGQANTNDINNVIDNLTVRAAGRFYNAENSGSQARPYGFGWGDHGGGYKNIFRNCQGFDLQYATSTRGFKSYVEDCSLFGYVNAFAYQNQSCGTAIKNCRLIANGGSSVIPFVILDTAIDDSEPLSILDCYASGLTGHFLHYQNSADIFNNVKLIGNRCSFKKGTANRIGGIGGSGSASNLSGYFLGTDWEVRDNQVDMPESGIPLLSGQTAFAFFCPRFDCNPTNDVPVQTGLIDFYVRVMAGSDVDIQLPVQSTMYEVSLSADYNDSCNAQGMLFIPSPLNNWTAGDKSPLAESNKGSYVNAITTSGEVDGKLNVAVTADGKLLLHNKGTTSAYLTVNVRVVGA